ncbi:hypothetical protein F4815DRAFT_502221 [Daldinia loculata]|nr:hypothetical protein F4815DRAFT_502221 [Daldinia loculata]
MAYAVPSSKKAKPPDFWIVTKIDGVYRPLAGVRRQRPSKASTEGSTTFLWIKTILSEPANRVSIEAERAMAIDFYRAGFISSVVGDQFPFIGECLLQGVCYHRSSDLYTQNTRPLPLIDSIYNPYWIPGNMVVFDITNLSDLRGGIMLPDVIITQRYHLFSAADFVTEFGYVDTIGANRSISCKFHLAAFSAGPPSLADMSRIEIRPLLEWNSLQGISQGAWVLLLSIEGKSQVQAVKYALVRMNGDSYNKFTPYGARVTSSEIDVVGLKEFLAISAPAVDPALVDRSLAETTKHMASWVNEADKSPELERLSVMDLHETVTMLNECLQSIFNFMDDTSSSRSSQGPAYWFLPAHSGRL